MDRYIEQKQKEMSLVPEISKEPEKIIQKRKSQIKEQIDTWHNYLDNQMCFGEITDQEMKQNFEMLESIYGKLNQSLADLKQQMSREGIESQEIGRWMNKLIEQQDKQSNDCIQDAFRMVKEAGSKNFDDEKKYEILICDSASFITIISLS